MCGFAAGVTAGSAESVDDAIWFPDADPWCLYSGYAKAKIMRRLITAPITDAQRDRLAAIVLAAVDIGWRWEFPDTVKLARRIGGRTLCVGLRVRLHAADLPTASRATIALVRLRQPRLTEQDRRRAREVVLSDLRNLADHDRDTYFTWSARTARILMDADWLAELRREAVAAGANREPARAIIYQLNRSGWDDGASTA